MRIFWCLLAITSLYSVVYAGPSSLVYQGRITRPGGAAFSGSSTDFIFSVLGDNQTCVLYREEVNAVAVSDGVFDTSFGNPLNMTDRKFISPEASNDFRYVFDNSISGVLSCEGGGSWTPLAGSIRYLRVQFRDENSVYQTLNQSLPIHSVPFAISAVKSLKSSDAEKLGGTVASLYAQKPGASCGTGVVGFDGTSLGCVSLSALNVDWSTIAGKPTSFTPATHTHVVDEISSASGKYFSYKPNNIACSNNEVLKWSGSSWICAADNAGTFTSPLTTKGDIFLHNGTSDSRLAVGTNGQSLVADSTQASGVKWAYIRMEDIRSTVGGAQMIPSTACSSAEVLAWSSVTDRFTCSTLSAAVLTSGTLDSARFADDSIAYSKLNSAARIWTQSGSDIYRSSGKVAIGTTSPEADLDVNGLTQFRKSYFEAAVSLGALPCSSTNIDYQNNIIEVGVCNNGTSTVNIPTISGWPAGAKVWSVVFLANAGTNSVFNVTYNGSLTNVYWDRNSTGTLGGNNFVGFPLSDGTTSVITCSVVNLSTVKVYCGVGAQY